MDKQVKEIIVPTMAYACASMVTLWLFIFNETTMPFSLLGRQYTLALSFLGAPLLASLTAFYASIVTEKLLVGEAAEPLSEGLRRLALTSFLYYASDWALLPAWVKPISAFIFYASILSMAHKALSSVLEPINQLFESILSSVYILFIGYLGSVTWLSLYPHLEDMLLNSGFAPVLLPYLQQGVAGPINNVIVASSALVSVLALTGVLRNHPNVYLRYISGVTSGRLEQITVLSFLVLYYFFFVRVFLLQGSGLNPQYVVVGEWAALCIGFYAAYRAVKRYASESLVREDYTGTWRRHVQQVSLSSEPELELFETLLDGFVNRGERAALVVHLALLLRSSGLSPNALTRALSPLINYSDAPLPKIGLSWQVENTKRHNMQRRREIINTVLGSIQLKPHEQETQEKQSPHEEVKEAG
ncbi:MAG: hypothetical protein ABIJ47_11110 [Candidatus Bathyarchaeota archaeon]